MEPEAHFVVSRFPHAAWEGRDSTDGVLKKMECIKTIWVQIRVVNKRIRNGGMLGLSGE